MEGQRVLLRPSTFALLGVLLGACSDDSSASATPHDSGVNDAGLDASVDAVSDSNIDASTSITDAALCGQPIMKCGTATCDTTSQVCCDADGETACVAKSECPGFASDAGPGFSARFECSSAANCPAGLLCCSATYPGSVCLAACPVFGADAGPSAALCVCDSDCDGDGEKCVPLADSPALYAWGHCEPK